MTLKELLNIDLINKFNSIFSKDKTKYKRKLKKTIKIQASEGIADSVILESMLTGRRLNLSIPGTTNAYTEYESQVCETYRKYSAQSDFGCQQTRAIIDLRTAFISGEGISVSAEKEATAKWLEEFINYNKLNGKNFINGVQGTEMAGQTIFILKRIYNEDNELQIKVKRIPYLSNRKYKPKYEDDLFKEKVIDVLFKSKFGWISFGYKDFIYIRTGGDDSNSYGPVTRIGAVLTDVENYDRAIKDIRRINHILARITPVFKTTTSVETTALQARLNEIKWRIGEVFIGEADLSYITPGTGAHDNLKSELVATIKTISGTTGVPVHWFGYVDLMSNRATAQSLYENIKNATSTERTIWQDSLYELILKAQKKYINEGGLGLSFDPNFQVRLPLISFENFLEKVRALNIAYNDEVISLDDYRNEIPGIDPLKTKKAIELEKKKEQDELIKMGISKIPEKNNTFPKEEKDE